MLSAAALSYGFFYGFAVALGLWPKSGSIGISPRIERTALNTASRGVDFAAAQMAFADRSRVIAEDTAHGSREKRYFCFGQVGAGVLTVRFTYRARVIRIIDAGYWRKGKQIYDRENQIQR